MHLRFQAVPKNVNAQSNNQIYCKKLEIGIYAPRLAFKRDGSELVLGVHGLNSCRRLLSYSSFFRHRVKLVGAVGEVQLYTKCNARISRGGTTEGGKLRAAVIRQDKGLRGSSSKLASSLNGSLSSRRPRRS